MEQSNNRTIILISTLLLASFAAYFIFQYLKFNDGKLHLVFCNVGQGDGIFIRTPKGKDILIDAGPDDSILNCLSKHMPFWDRTLELMILSHPHQDHTRGMIPVLKRYKVLSFATEELENDTVLYEELMKRVQSSNFPAERDPASQGKLPTKYLYSGDRIKTSDGVVLKVLGPSREFLARTSPSGKINESGEFGSLIIFVSYKNFDALLTSDSQLEGLKEAVQGFSESIEVFQVPHHGSKYGMDEEFISKIKPKIAIISVGKNSYGHPSKTVREKLDNFKIKTLRTDKNGEIKISSNGEGMKVSLKRSAWE